MKRKYVILLCQNQNNVNDIRSDKVIQLIRKTKR